MSPKKALYWFIFWKVLALLFNLWIYLEYNQQKALEFLTGFIIEFSLSFDNLFVFLLLFTYFNIPSTYQRRVLNWGIGGVIIFRGIFIFLGVILIEKFKFILYLFAVTLIYAGYKMSFMSEIEIHPEKNKLLKLYKKFFKVSTELHSNKFFIKKEGIIYATPLFVCLLVIESTDVVFAIDSIPAIFAITLDPFIVFTSNLFAILGLRSLYFVLVALADKFHFVKKGVGIILVYAGIKILVPFFSSGYHIPTFVSLLVIFAVLSFSVLFSIIMTNKNNN